MVERCTSFSLWAIRVRIPRLVALAWAYVDTGLARLDPRHVPAATPDAVRVSAKKEYFSSAKAVHALGYSFIPAREALRKAVEWYRANGYARVGTVPAPIRF